VPDLRGLRQVRLGPRSELALRHAHVVTGGLAVAVVMLSVFGVGDDFPPTAIAAVLTLLLCYWCGAHAPTGPGLAAVVALAVAIQIHVGFADAPNAEIAIATLPPWWGGLEVRRRRELVAELANRTRELEAEEESFVALSVQRERARIARDLHDIVSHHLAVMVIQAGAGRLAEPWQADAAAARFETIRDAGVQALGEAERLVTLLHAGGAGAPRLTPLLERARATGARVVVMPPDLALALDVEATAHRIVQEALTNAMKHAPGAAVQVDVELTDTNLVITVGNEGVAERSPIAQTGSGLGLAGMRERLAALGGSIEAGPLADGGFRLRARLPVEPEMPVLQPLGKP
jgi:signal transduction histidine kinase